MVILNPLMPDDPVKLAVVNTDSEGKAQYTYTAGKTAGYVSIKVESGTLSKVLLIKQTGGLPSALDLSASPSVIYANGVNASTISVNVRDANNNLVNDAVNIVLKTESDAGTALAGTLSKTNLTTENGVATTSLISPITPSPIKDFSAVVTGTMIVNGNSVSKTVNVKFLGVAVSDLKANPDSLTANSSEESKITVRLKDANGIAICR